MTSVKASLCISGHHLQLVTCTDLLIRRGEKAARRRGDQAVIPLQDGGAQSAALVAGCDSKWTDVAGRLEQVVQMLVKDGRPFHSLALVLLDIAEIAAPNIFGDVPADQSPVAARLSLEDGTGRYSLLVLGKLLMAPNRTEKPHELTPGTTPLRFLIKGQNEGARGVQGLVEAFEQITLGSRAARVDLEEQTVCRVWRISIYDPRS